MTVNKNITDLVISMVMCHDSEDFSKLTSLMDVSTLEDRDTFFSQDRFNQVCAKIHEHLGEFLAIEYIGSLNKENALHTLWKAKYTKTDEDTLWQVRINLNDQDPKIVKMSIN